MDKDDLASLDVAWESTGLKTHDDGQPIPTTTTTRQVLLNLIARKKEEEESRLWKIVVGHNVEYTTTYLQIYCQRVIEQKRTELKMVINFLLLYTISMSC